MSKCAYCNNSATTEDAVGLPACKKHANEADDYFEKQTGRKPDEDTFLFCDKHCDLWQSGCPRCEECCQHHYGCSIKEKFNDDGSIEQRSKNWKITHFSQKVKKSTL